ncbi:MAG: peptide chain release factor-like protein [Verrucomicrobiota bacterium]
MDSDPQLLKRMTRLRILEPDILERFIRGSGPGGQKINKTASCVYLKHLPSGIEIKCQQERSRDLNRQIARHLLCDEIEKRRRHAEQKQREAAARKRYQTRKPSRTAQERRLRSKRFRAERKQQRRRPTGDD